MATIIRKDNALEREYIKSKKIRNIGALGVVVFFIAFSIVGVQWMRFDLAPYLMFGFGGSGLLTGYYINRTRSYQAGVEGERSTAEIISSLPDTYYGIQNLKISYEGKESELDMVVVGPSGVFVIETKNMNGTIVGNYDNPQWTQRKIGQQGTPYSKKFYNPVKQVGTHVYRLANVLKSKGLSVYVNGMVYFANPDTIVQVMGEETKTPVFSALKNSSKEICNTILCGGQSVSPDVVEKIRVMLGN